ncbi:MAG: RNA polymerase factor sigma-54 [Kiritimatiellia bacterium]
MTQQPQQRLQLAPQQLQSLEVLQAPVLELRAILRRELETNPFLEDDSAPLETSADAPADAAPAEDGDVPHPDDAETAEDPDAIADAVLREMGGDNAPAAWDGSPAASPGSSPSEGDAPNDLPPAAGEPEQAGAESQADLPGLERLSLEWDETYGEQLAGEVPSEEAEERRRFLFDSLTRKETLQEHLLAQLYFVELPPAEKIVATTLVGALNGDGYLVETMESLEEMTGAPPDTIANAIAALQELEPAGVGARDLQECLLLQLDRLPATPAALLAREILGRHAALLEKRKFTALARALRRTPEEIEEAVALMRSLDPSPGRTFQPAFNPVVVPEILVRYDEETERYVVEVDDTFLPRVRLNTRNERAFLSAKTSDDVRNELRKRLDTARSLPRSLEQRQNTIARIAQAIVDSQQEFFEKGVAYLKPMTMADIASIVEVHETTVSRTVSNKYLRTPSGAVVLLKDFFSTGLHTIGGADISNKTVQDRIATIIRNEDPARPLSDQDIMDILGDQGIPIARRTVAKYRDVLKIPASHLRRRQ